MVHDPAGPTPTPTPTSTSTRRAFLRLAALAPVAAGCAGVKVGPADPEPAAGPAPVRAGEARAAIRAFQLPDGAEPASVFRALAPRRGGR